MEGLHDLASVIFHWEPLMFDEIIFGRVFGQEEQLASCFFHDSFGGVGLMEACVVEDDG